MKMEESFASDDGEDYLKTDLKFEQGGVSQRFSVNEHRMREFLVSGRLFITENRFGEYLEWKPEKELEIRPKFSKHGKDWALVHGSTSSGGGIGFRPGNEDKIEFRPDEHLLNDFKRPIKIELLEIRSFQVIGNNEMIFYRCDGTTQNPFIFEKGSPENLISALERSVSISKGKQRNLYIVSPKRETRANSVYQLDIPIPEHVNNLWQFGKGLRDDPMTTILGTFARISDLTTNGNVDPYRMNKSPTHNNIHTPVNPPNSHASPRPVSRADSTGMDADYTTNEEGYEVIFKPETLGVELPPRPDTFRGQPLSQEQWLNYMDNEGRVNNSHEIIQIIFRGGIDPEIRKHVWPFLLGFYNWDSTFAEREAYFTSKSLDYARYKTQWNSIDAEQEERFHAFRDYKSLIEKDVSRTDRCLDFFKDEGNNWTETLKQILMTYMMYNFNLGYVQGMSDILSPLLMEIQEEVMTFYLFAKFMERIETNFEMSQEGMQRQLKDLYLLLQLIDPKFSAYLQACDADNMYFAFRWLLILFKREFSTENTLSLWETFWTKLPGPNFHLFFALAILKNHSSIIMNLKYGLSEILRHCNDLSLKIDLEDGLKLAEAMYIQVLGVQDKLPDKIRKIIGLPPIEKPNGESATTSSSSPINEGGGDIAGNMIVSDSPEESSPSHNSVPPVQPERTFEENLEKSYEMGMSTQFL